MNRFKEDRVSAGACPDDPAHPLAAARPKQAAGALPLVLVVHENRGLNPHTEDITRRLALDGFIALAPDAMRPLAWSRTVAFFRRTLAA